MTTRSLFPAGYGKENSSSTKNLKQTNISHSQKRDNNILKNVNNHNSNINKISTGDSNNSTAINDDIYGQILSFICPDYPFGVSSNLNNNNLNPNNNYNFSSNKNAPILPFPPPLSSPSFSFNSPPPPPPPPPISMTNMSNSNNNFNNEKFFNNSLNNNHNIHNSNGNNSNLYHNGNVTQSHIKYYNNTNNINLDTSKIDFFSQNFKYPTTQDILSSFPWDPDKKYIKTVMYDHKGYPKNVIIKHIYIPSTHSLKTITNEIYMYIQQPFGNPTIIKDFIIHSSLTGRGAHISVLIEAMEGIFEDLPELKSMKDNATALYNLVDQFITQLESFHMATDKGHTRLFPHNLMRDQNSNLRISDFLGKLQFINIFESLKTSNIILIKKTKSDITELLNDDNLLPYIAPELRDSLNKLSQSISDVLKSLPLSNPTQSFKILNDLAYIEDWNNYSTKMADIYSAGACLYYLLAKMKGLSIPHPSKSSISLKKLNGYPPLLLNLLHGMLKQERSKRLTILQCSCHPYLWKAKDLELYLLNILYQILCPSELDYGLDIFNPNVAKCLKEPFDKAEHVYQLFPSLLESFYDLLKYPDTIQNVSLLKESILEESKLGLLLLMGSLSLKDDISTERRHEILTSIISKYPDLLIQSLDFFLYPKIHDSSIAWGTIEKLPFLQTVKYIKSFILSLKLNKNSTESNNKLPSNFQNKKKEGNSKSSNNLSKNMAMNSCPPNNSKEHNETLIPPSNDMNKQSTPQQQTLDNPKLPSNLLSSKFISAVPPPYSSLKERATRNAVLHPNSWFPNAQIPPHLRWYGEISDEAFELWLEQKDNIESQQKDNSSLETSDGIITPSNHQNHNKEVNTSEKEINSVSIIQKDEVTSSQISETIIKPLINLPYLEDRQKCSMKSTNILNTTSIPPTEPTSPNKYSVLLLARGIFLYKHFFAELNSYKKVNSKGDK